MNPSAVDEPAHHSTASRPSPPTLAASPAPSSPSGPRLPNAHRAHGSDDAHGCDDRDDRDDRDDAPDDGPDDAPNESEAETVVLGDRGDAREHSAAAPAKRLIKREPDRDDLDHRDDRAFTSAANGATHGSDGDASPLQPAASPPHPATRGRSCSNLEMLENRESRKRKTRDESHPKSLEPPRRKAKTEGPRDSRAFPTSPATPGPGRPHRRSQSTQSVAHGAPGRKRSELGLTLPTEPRNWSDSSSETSSSNHLQTPGLTSQARTKRSSHRALTSPARAMGHKRNVDKFGATRLARESEKGDLAAVKAAFDAAPEELDQVDFAGIAPLQKAALHGWDGVVEFLLDKGCRTDCESNDRDTPLIDAVENGHLEVVRLLLKHGQVNAHHQNKKGQRAIDVLDPDDDDFDEIEKLLKDAMLRQTDTLKSEEQAQPSQLKSAPRLLHNEYNTETLIEKAGDGDLVAVGELINSNIKVNIACGVAASRGGHYDILSVLLASGLKADPDPSKHSETPMLVAIGRGHLKIVKLLLELDIFNPTRRNREGKTYWEISEERQGPKWEQERDMLKKAYDDYLRTHKSPKRIKKEAPNPSAVRKRKSSPTRKDSFPLPPSHKQKARRLMSGKEMASRDKRRRRVVSDESSTDESEDDVRPPRKRDVALPRSYSEGEDPKLKQSARKPRSEGLRISKSSVRARSDDSDDQVVTKRPEKIRTKSQKLNRIKPTPTPDAESHDERKPVNKLIKSHVLDDKTKKRRASEVSMDETKVKRTPSQSAKSTPVPPEKASTPEISRERRLEADRQASEAKRRAAEAEAKKREEEDAARKAAHEEEVRKKAEAEAEAKRLAEEAEITRIKEEEESRQKAEDEAKRRQVLAARQSRLSKLPRALRRACELGNNRPLHFSGEEFGISAVFLPLFYATSRDLLPNEHQNAVCKSYIMSFQAVGILGLPELDIARLGPPYSTWERIDVSRKHRELLLRQYDVGLLAQDYRFPMEGTPDFDYTEIQERIREARQQFLDMEGLYWIEDTAIYPAIEVVESLRSLVNDMKDLSKREHIHIGESEAENSSEGKQRVRVKKSFMDVLGQRSGTNGNG